MELKKYLYRAANIVAVGQDSLFKIPVKKQKKFLEEIKEPKDLIERSYNQYLCQRRLKSKFVNIMTDIASMFLLVYYFNKKEDQIPNPEHAKAVYLGMGVSGDIIPEELEKAYGGILNVSKVGEYLDKGDKKIIKKLLQRYPLSFEFDKCYIWDSYYMDLFRQLRAFAEQFTVAVPPALILKGSYAKKYDYTYYLGGEKREALVRIQELLIRLKAMGYRVAVRPHPRYSQMVLVDKLFRGKVDIEDPYKIQIKESILSTENIISLYSTVINQAVNSGVKAIIDDVSDVEKYKLLQELQYRFMVDRKILLVSELALK